MSALQDKYINPLTDFGFKKLFGSEPNKDLLIHFLNQILPENHQITSLTYAQNEHLENLEIDRKAIFDIYCKGKNGESFIVEIQKAKQNYFKDRSVFYASFPIQEQAQKGDWNYQLQPIYTVGILDFNFVETKNDPEFLHQVNLKDQECKVFYEKLQFIFIELPKFKKTEEELETQFEKWLFVLKHLANLQNRPKGLQERVFKKLFEKAEIAKFTPEERQTYESSLKYYRDIKTVIDTAKEEGVKKGKTERSIEIAELMKKSDEPLNKIIQFTGLSPEEIENL